MGGTAPTGSIASTGFGGGAEMSGGGYGWETYTLVLADGVTEVSGRLRGASIEVVAAADNFVFRHRRAILDALDVEAAAIDQSFFFPAPSVAAPRNRYDCDGGDDENALTAMVAKKTLPVSPVPGGAALALSTISHVLRRLGAPLSVVTGPLYLSSHLVEETEELLDDASDATFWVGG